jgi:shikimate 5-dehydrogenase
MVYNPKETRLLKEAAQAGSHCISGSSMFEAQALKQIQLTYGLTP